MVIFIPATRELTEELCTQNITLVSRGGVRGLTGCPVRPLLPRVSNINSKPQHQVTPAPPEAAAALTAPASTAPRVLACQVRAGRVAARDSRLAGETRLDRLVRRPSWRGGARPRPA